MFGLSRNQTRLLIGVLAAFGISVVGTIGLDPAYVTPLQALIGGIAGVLQMGPDDTDARPLAVPPTAGH